MITITITPAEANALAYAIGARRREIEDRVDVAERRRAVAVARAYAKEDSLLGAVAVQLDRQMVEVDRAEREERDDIQGLDGIPLWMLGMPVEQD